VIVSCKHCGEVTNLEQPHPYHAGFGNEGFLYDDAGTCTLVWSSFDPDYTQLIGQKHPWTLTSEEQRKVEEALAAAPNGGRWRFSNPPRCASCGKPIGRPITEDIYYLLFPGSCEFDRPPEVGLRHAMRDTG